MRRRLPLGIALLALAGIGAVFVLQPRAETTTGVIVAVDARSIGDVRGFTLRTAAGETIAFTLGVLENPTQFPPGHLVSHVVSGAPVVVSYRVTNGTRTVFRLEDAPGASPAASPTAGPGAT